MRVLVACEYSGAVRDAFRAMGHFAMSCDLLPTDVPGPHYQGSVLDVLDEDWDMMIAFPPCTHLAVSGARWFAAKRADGRQQMAIDFFMALANADIPKIAIENPVCIMSTQWRKPGR
jgi:site-specific DNA-cytosine methylase